MFVATTTDNRAEVHLPPKADRGSGVSPLAGSQDVDGTLAGGVQHGVAALSGGRKSGGFLNQLLPVPQREEKWFRDEQC